MPDRIQRTRAKGDRLPPGTLCVTRPGRMGNPFGAVWHGASFQFWDVVGPVFPGRPYSRVHTELEAVEIAVECYRVWAPQQPWFAEKLVEAGRPCTSPAGARCSCRTA